MKYVRKVSMLGSSAQLRPETTKESGDMFLRRLKAALANTPMRFRPEAERHGFCSVSTPAAPEAERKAYFGRRVVQLLLVGLTGGVAISGISDFVIFYGCTEYVFCSPLSLSRSLTSRIVIRFFS